MSLCRYVAMCPLLCLATRRRISLDYVVLVSSCTLYFVGKLNYCCGWKINSIHEQIDVVNVQGDWKMYEYNECMSVRTRRCPVERVDLMRGDDTGEHTAPVTAGAQYYWIYIDIMQLAFREGRSELKWRRMPRLPKEDDWTGRLMGSFADQFAHIFLVSEPPQSPEGIIIIFLA